MRTLQKKMVDDRAQMVVGAPTRVSWLRRRWAVMVLLSTAIYHLPTSSKAQQLPQLSQYVFNDYVFNPAFAGSRPWFELRTGHRYQWVGITDAPRTFTLSGTTPLGRKMGVGGLVFTDHVGPTRRTGFQASYSYHLKLTSELKLSLAASFGLLEFMVDGSKITFHDAGDPVIDGQVRRDVVPDATFGALLYHPSWWAGFALPQLMRNDIQFYDAGTQSLNELAAHYHIMGGYRLDLNDELRLEPQALIKYVSPVPVKVDLTALLRYREQFWLGATYRTNDAMSFMLGCWLKRTWQFGYSYDVTTTGLKDYSDGTHEVMLAITFGKERPAEVVVQ